MIRWLTKMRELWMPIRVTPNFPPACLNFTHAHIVEAHVLSFFFSSSIYLPKYFLKKIIQPYMDPLKWAYVAPMWYSANGGTVWDEGHRIFHNKSKRWPPRFFQCTLAIQSWIKFLPLNVTPTRKKTKHSFLCCFLATPILAGDMEMDSKRL